MLTDEQKALRRTGITATDAAAIFGLSPFKSPLDVYRTKIGELEDVPAQIELEGGDLRETKDQERGRFLEPALVAWAGSRIGKPTEHTPSLTVRCAWDPLILASPDGWVHVGGGGMLKDRFPLETKAPGTFHRSDEWGPDGADAEGNVPPDHEVQLRIQMAATSADQGWLAALIGPELRVYHLRRDVEWEKKAVARLHEWHERHVVAKVPPKVSASERDQNWLKAKYPHDKLPAMREAELTPDQRMMVRQMLAAYQQRDVFKALYEEHQTALKEILGDHGGLLLTDGWRVDWKSNRPGSETNWEALARDLHRRLALVVGPGLGEEEEKKSEPLCRPLPDEIAAFTKITPGNRVFRPYPPPKGKKA